MEEGDQEGSTRGMGRREGKLQLVFCCSARGDPEDRVWGSRESGEGSQAACSSHKNILIFKMKPPKDTYEVF